jgi:hypothetical protein
VVLPQLGNPCLRRKYCGAPGLETGSAEWIWRVGEGGSDEDACALLWLSSPGLELGGGCKPLWSARHGKLRASMMAQAASESESGSWENGRETSYRPHRHEIASINVNSEMGFKVLTPGMVTEFFTDGYERRTWNQGQAFSVDANKKRDVERFRLQKRPNHSWCRIDWGIGGHIRVVRR